MIIADIMPINYAKLGGKYRAGTDLHGILEKLNAMNLKRDIKSLKKEIKEYEPNDDVVNFMATNLQQVGKDEYRWRCNLPAIVANYREIVQDEIALGNGKKFDGKVKVIMGGNSSYLVPECIESFGRVFSQFDEKRDLEIIQGAGHWLHFDKPYDFIEIVSRFLKEVASEDK